MKPSIIHAYLYGMLRREVGGGKIIRISQINPIVKWVIRVPRKYQYEVINEMIKYNYLKKLDRDTYELSEIKVKIPLYDSLGEPLW